MRNCCRPFYAVNVRVVDRPLSLFYTEHADSTPGPIDPAFKELVGTVGLSVALDPPILCRDKGFPGLDQLCRQDIKAIGSDLEPFVGSVEGD